MKQNGNDWSFAEVSRTETRWGPHGYHRYPAKFIPQIVKRLLDTYGSPGDYVGDLFLGSGTTGVEAIRSGYKFYGVDINAVARLISQAKCIPIEPTMIQATWDNLSTRLSLVSALGQQPLSEKDKQAIASIDISHASADERLLYWFPQKQRDALHQILEIVRDVKIEQHRVFLLCAFSNILKRCSIWLSGSTKAQKDLKKVLADPIKDFSKQVQDMIKRNNLYWNSLIAADIDPSIVSQTVQIDQQDTRALKQTTPHLDLLITSPPYATCYEYSELHQLTQIWFEKYNIIPISTSKQNWIGSRNGATLPSSDMVDKVISSTAAIQSLVKLEEVADRNASENKTAILREIRALRRYFLDMQKAIEKMSSVIKCEKYMIFVIGDSRKRNVDIPTTQALIDMSCSAGFELVDNIKRKIPGRVLVSTRDLQSGRFSSSADSDIQVYPEENILVLKRR